MAALAQAMPEPPVERGETTPAAPARMGLVIESDMLPFRIVSKTPFDEDTVLRFCEQNVVRVEQEPDGALCVMSPTGSETGDRGSELNLQLRQWAKKQGLGKVFDSSAGFRMPDGSMRSPDASWIHLSHWNALTDEERRRFAPVCPEFIVELLSPTDTLDEVRAKMGEWLRNGVQLGWLLDPDRKIVEVYRAGTEGPEVLKSPDSVSGEGPVEGFVLNLREIWGGA